MENNAFDWYEEKTAAFALQAKDPRNTLTVYVLGLAGEAGEVVEKYKKHLRDGNELNRDDIAKELGDVLWYIAAIARELKMPLYNIAQENYEKLTSRANRGVLGGSGDNR